MLLMMLINLKFLFFIIVYSSITNASLCPMSDLRNNNLVSDRYQYNYPDMYYKNHTFNLFNSYNCSYVNAYPYYTIPMLKCPMNFICPINQVNIATALSKQKWIGTTKTFEKIASISHMMKNNNISKDEINSTITINIFFIGGSMTLGSDINCGCICTSDIDVRCKLNKKDKCNDIYDSIEPCRWQSLFFKWLKDYYHDINHIIEFHHIDFAQGGVGSEFQASAFSSKVYGSNIILSEYDLFFLDSSANDAGYFKVSSTKMGLESLITRIQYLMSKTLNNSMIRPTIILIEQFPFASNNPWPGSGRYPSKEYNFRDYAVYYEDLAKHYNLLLWSVRAVYWSYYDETIDITDRYPIDVLGKDPMHVYPHIPWFGNLYIADILANCFLHVMRNIELSMLNHKSIDPNILIHHHSNCSINSTGYPKPLYLSETNILKFCDESKPFLLHNISLSTFHPQNLYEYESMEGVGWREYIDYHGVSGWMINKHSNESLRALTFKFIIQPSLSSSLSNSVVDFSKYILKITYLQSYENMGTIKVFLCGNEIVQLDGLHADYMHYKVSCPQFYLYNEIPMICNNANYNQYELKILYINPMNNLIERKAAKFKLMKAEICERGEDSV